MTQFGLHSVPCAAEVYVDDAVKFLVGRFEHRCAVAVYASVVEGRIKATIGSDRPVDHRAYPAPVRHIAGDIEDIVACRSKSIRSLFEQGRVVIREDHRRPGFSKRARRGKTDAPASPRNQRNSSVKSLVCRAVTNQSNGASVLC